MAFRPNYHQQRGDRNRAKEEKRRERLERREEESRKRKAERDGLLGEAPAETEGEGDAPAGSPGAGEQTGNDA